MQFNHAHANFPTAACEHLDVELTNRRKRKIMSQAEKRMNILLTGCKSL